MCPLTLFDSSTPVSPISANAIIRYFCLSLRVAHSLSSSRYRASLFVISRSPPPVHSTRSPMKTAHPIVYMVPCSRSRWRSSAPVRSDKQGELCALSLVVAQRRPLQETPNRNDILRGNRELEFERPNEHEQDDFYPVSGIGLDESEPALVGGRTRRARTGSRCMRARLRGRPAGFPTRRGWRRCSSAGSSTSPA